MENLDKIDPNVCLCAEFAHLKCFLSSCVGSSINIPRVSSSGAAANSLFHPSMAGDSNSLTWNSSIHTENFSVWPRTHRLATSWTGANALRPTAIDNGLSSACAASAARRAGCCARARFSAIRSNTPWAAGAVPIKVASRKEITLVHHGDNRL